MKSSWTKGLEKDVAKEVTLSFNAGGILRERLQEVLKDKSKSSENESLNASGYDNANWAYKQADVVGYRRALREVISLLDK